MIGKTILHYNILEKLGEGGMGVVYLAEDTKLKRQVAIKFLPHHISANEEERKRFKIEAQAAAALNHPNIATIYAIEESDFEVFIVMEYIEGKELKSLVETRHAPSLSVEVIINYAIQIAEGLEAAHKKGIIHRDIKSSNIMITESGIVKIMDFGLAKVGKGTQLTQVGSTLGTIEFMSPEQTRGKEVDHRTDIWSFGVVFYEMLTAKMPFRGDYDQAIIYSILNEEPEPLGDVDQGLKHIVSKSLAKNPDERYQSAAEIVNELRTIREGGTIKKAAKHSKLPWIIAGAITIVIAAVLYFFVPLQKNIEEKNIEVAKTLAVLPFLDLSANKDQEYFCDGLSDELISALAKNPKLRVISRTSSFIFKGKNVDIKTIASKLNVKNILEGSVQKSGNNLRIMADLINAETDATLWSNTYKGTFSNIFDLQDSITGSVAEALDVALLGKIKSTGQWKTDPKAYNDYLLGIHFYRTYTKEGLEKGASYFEKTLSIDSGYAPAWVQLSTVHSIQADYAYIPLDEGYHKARQEAEKALELDPNNVAAFSRMGYIKRTYDWEWTGADNYYKKALKLEPEHAGALNGAATLAATLGHFDEAISLTRRLIELEPVNASLYYNLGYYNFCMGFLEKSIAAYRKSLEISPQIPGSEACISLSYLFEGKPDSALSAMNRESWPFLKMYGLAIVYYASNRKKDADDKLAELIKEYQDNSAFQIAEVYAYRGDDDKAFEWLERAYKQRDGGLAMMEGDPLLKSIEKDPRYKVFMNKMKLPL